MSNRDKKLSKLAQGDAINITPVEAMHLGVHRNDNAFVALKYFDPSYQCFSCWKSEELSAFSKFISNINQQSWQSIVASGGKIGHKTGLGYTQHKDRNKLPNHKIVDSISEDINFFELRISEKARVHGFRVKSTFFLVWLDRNHEIYRM